MEATKQTTTVTVELEPEDIEILRELSRKRRLSMTGALLRAIRQSKDLDDLVSAGGTLLLEEPDRTFKKLTLK